MNYLVIGIILLLVVTYPILYSIVRTKAGKKYAYSLAGLIIALLFWAIKIVIYVAFVSLFVAIVITAFYHFYWVVLY